MFCPNCAGNLQAVDTEVLLSQGLQYGDYFTHQCEVCLTYWHLHVHSGDVDLISTKSNQAIASKKITNDLAKELRKRADELDGEE